MHGQRNKYGNKRTVSRAVGRVFDSKGERHLADVLHARLAAGEISDLRFQVSVDLCGLVRMRPDFGYREQGLRILHEYKGYPTPTYRLQVKVMAQVGFVVCDEYRINYGTRLEVIRPRPSQALIDAIGRYERPAYVAECEQGDAPLRRDGGCVRTIHPDIERSEEKQPCA